MQRYQPCVVLERAGLKDAVAIAYEGLLGRFSKLSATDQGEALADVSDGLKQEGTNSSFGTDRGCPAFVLATCCLNVTRLDK